MLTLKHKNKNERNLVNNFKKINLIPYNVIELI